MPPSQIAIFAKSDAIQLERGQLHVEITMRPFSFTIRRAGRSLVRAAGVWVVEGAVEDQFIQLTEGVIAQEDCAPAERSLHAVLADECRDGVVLEVSLEGGRHVRLSIELADPDRVELVLTPDGAPLRLAIDWDRRSEERIVGLGARHSTRLDHAGRRIELGADRRYTGPDCPPEMLARAGFPRVTVRRCPG
jgi:hypothetical protein